MIESLLRIPRILRFRAEPRIATGKSVGILPLALNDLHQRRSRHQTLAYNNASKTTVTNANYNREKLLASI